jgi:hypothetical protein
VETISVSTVVYRPPEPVYEFLLDFPGYTNYTEYLREVRRGGDGGPGTRYELVFSWWVVTYTTRSTVTDVDPPRRIDWRVTKDVDAEGYWAVDPVEVPADAPGDVEAASRVTFEVSYDPDSVRAGGIDLPAFVSLDSVIDRVRPLVLEEAERIVERIVADIEGRSRPVELDVERTRT